MRRYVQQPISVLARLIVARRVLSYVWRAQTWIPMFQFEPATMAVRRGSSGAIEELADTFDELELAEWFAAPNSWLAGAAPMDMSDADEESIIRAARADRYIARG